MCVEKSRVESLGGMTPLAPPPGPEPPKKKTRKSKGEDVKGEKRKLFEIPLTTDLYQNRRRIEKHSNQKTPAHGMCLLVRPSPVVMHPDLSRAGGGGNLGVL